MSDLVQKYREQLEESRAELNLANAVTASTYKQQVALALEAHSAGVPDSVISKALGRDLHALQQHPQWKANPRRRSAR